MRYTVGVNGARLVREIRQATGLTQAAFAKKVGTSQPTISQYENDVKSPSVGTLSNLAAACGFELRAEVMQRPRESPTTKLAKDLVEEARTPARIRLVVQFLKDAERSSRPKVLSEPPPRVDPVVDAMVAATVELACIEQGARVPDWTAGADRFLVRWVFLSPTEGLRASTLADAAPTFAARGVFVSRASLTSV